MHLLNKWLHYLLWSVVVRSKGCMWAIAAAMWEVASSAWAFEASMGIVVGAVWVIAASMWSA